MYYERGSKKDDCFWDQLSAFSVNPGFIALHICQVYNMNMESEDLSDVTAIKSVYSMCNPSIELDKVSMTL